MFLCLSQHHNTYILITYIYMYRARDYIIHFFMLHIYIVYICIQTYIHMVRVWFIIYICTHIYIINRKPAGMCRPLLKKKPLVLRARRSDASTTSIAFGDTCVVPAAMPELSATYLHWSSILIYFNGIVHNKPTSYWGTPIYGKPQMRDTGGCLGS